MHDLVKDIRKLILSCLFIVCVTVFGGCDSYNRILPQSEDEKYINEMCDEIIRCFDEKDSESLKSMFCIGTQQYYDLDSEIQEAFSLYDGISTSYLISGKVSTGTKKDGKWSDQHYIPLIKNIKTTNGKEFNIGFCVYKIYDYNDDMVGIGVISLEDSDGNVLFAIGGYDWKNN